MKHFLSGLVLLCAIAAPAHARTTVTQEQAQAIALRQFEGEVVKAGREREDSVLTYNFRIMQPDGTVLEVEVSGEDGAIGEIEVEALGRGGQMPPARFNRKQAETAALAVIAENITKPGKIDLMETEYTLNGKKPVYKIAVRKGFTIYDVTLNANTGKILSYREAL